MGPPASSNFYTREIKKKRHAGGHDADMGIPISVIRDHPPASFGTMQICIEKTSTSFMADS
ncbi:hypothetical protein E5427_04705 [Escherichia coli]|nr:hypothetical protein [Escherichia coli]